jgi:hypothetical protein
VEQVAVVTLQEKHLPVLQPLLEALIRVVVAVEELLLMLVALLVKQAALA